MRYWMPLRPCRDAIGFPYQRICGHAVRCVSEMNSIDAKHIAAIRKKIGRAINTYSLIGSDDRVLVALSGGKDSLVLLDAVTARLSCLPIRYDVIAAHVDNRELPVSVSIDYLQEFCDARNVPLVVKKISPGIDFSRDTCACYACSMHRRRVLFDLMKETQCTRLAFGHHMDDIVETLMMNMVLNGKFSTMPLSLPVFGGQFDIIRPLGLLSEDEVLRYARIMDFRTGVGACPFGEKSKRAEMKKIIGQLENISKNARRNVFRSASNVADEYLP